VILRSSLSLSQNEGCGAGFLPSPQPAHQEGRTTSEVPLPVSHVGVGPIPGDHCLTFSRYEMPLQLAGRSQ